MIAGRGGIVLFLICLLWIVKMIPGWIIEKEMKKQLSLLPSAPNLSTRYLLSDDEESGIHENISRPKPSSLREDDIYAALRFIKDPELEINVVDLGLIQDVQIDHRGISITMILTTRFCPYQGRIVSSVKKAVMKISGLESVSVNVDYSRTWSIHKLSEAGKKQWSRIFQNGTRQE